jgi:hypothetical protein
MRDNSVATVIPFSDEQRRVLVNLAQQYDSWVEASRGLAALPYGMRWKTVSGKDYLYEVLDRIGNGKSLGPRSEATQALFDAFRSQKDELTAREKKSRAALDESCGIYRALRLPLIASEAAKILREADLRSLLGRHLLVIGTNTMPAYAIEAGGRIDGVPDETMDFDMTWMAPPDFHGPPPDGAPVWAMLKAVDPTYTVNTEKIFQARNAGAYEFELLVAPSIANTLVKRDRPSPVPLPEQEWLLLGRQVSHTVVARDGSPARLVAPDPRWFALHKLWLSHKETRNVLKKPKDAKQGTLLLSAIAESMPHFRLDAEFESALPAELRPHYDAWKETHAALGTNKPPPRW